MKSRYYNLDNIFGIKFVNASKSSLGYFGKEYKNSGRGDSNTRRTNPGICALFLHTEVISSIFYIKTPFLSALTARTETAPSKSIVKYAGGFIVFALEKI